MDRLKSLLKKASALLEGQWESFAAVDRWIQEERSVPDGIREEWKRIYQLQDFFRREHFRKIVEQLEGDGESREALKALRFVRGALRFLETGVPALTGLLEQLRQMLDADRGIAIACSEESSQARVLASANAGDADLASEELQISRTVFRDVLRSGRAVLIRNPLEDPAYAQQSSIHSGQVRSILATPVKGTKGTAGILYFDSGRMDRSFSDTDRLCLEHVLPLVRSLFFAPRDAAPGPAGKGAVFLDDERALRGLIGRDPEFQASLALLKKVAPTPAPVLLLGESGTGKELFARAIHALSPRRNGPFVAINSAAIPESLLESELFGHEKGAFTGADSARIGKLERAARGTVFLDEIGEMKPELQAKLLRFLQSGEIERVGGREGLRVDVRVIAATHQELARRVDEGGFRRDLYFRLNVFQIELPPLRKRRSDIRILTDHFYRKYGALLSFPETKVDPDIYAALEQYEFPGNVRELENIVYRSLVMSDRGVVTLECIPDEVKATAVMDLQKNPFLHLVKSVPEDYEELGRRRKRMQEICRREIAFLERRFAENLVAAAEGNISRAAQMAGIDRGQFHRLLKSEE